MTNYEYYKEQIERIARLGRSVAMKVTTGEIVYCGDINCNECLFQGSDVASCSQKAFKWADEEYTEPEVDWSKIPVDTPVLVSDDGVNWERRYFVRKSAEAMFGVYMHGATSWSADGYVVWYRYAKLAEVSDEESK